MERRLKIDHVDPDPRCAICASWMIREPFMTPKSIEGFGWFVWVEDPNYAVGRIKPPHPTALFGLLSMRLSEMQTSMKTLEFRKERISKRFLDQDYLHTAIPQPTFKRFTSDESVEDMKKVVQLWNEDLAMWLKTQDRFYYLIDKIAQIKKHTRDILDEIIEYLDELMNLPIAPVMIKKNPKTVDAAHDMWMNNLSFKPNGDISYFEHKQRMYIRELAKFVLKKYMVLFGVSESYMEFRKICNRQMIDFSKKTKNLSKEEIRQLTIDPSDPLYEHAKLYVSTIENLGDKIENLRLYNLD